MSKKTSLPPPAQKAEPVISIVYQSLKTASADKSGQRASGKVHYRLLTDEPRSELFVMIVGNDSSGYYSREAVPMAAIQQRLATLENPKAFSSSVFQSCFVGRSANNGGFLAAILRAEGILQPLPDKAHLHQFVLSDIDAWKAQLLQQPGEPFTVNLKAANEAVSATSDASAPATTETAMSSNQDSSETDTDDPIAVLTSRKQRRLPGEKHHHPSIDEEGEHVDTA